MTCITCRDYIEKHGPKVLALLHQFYHRALFDSEYVECQKIGMHIDKILDAMEKEPKQCQN